jgi:DNA-binding NarL/FixJ family response regulator
MKMVNVAIMDPCPIFSTGLAYYLNQFSGINIINNNKSVTSPHVVVMRATQATPQLRHQHGAAQWVVILEEITQAKAWLAQGVKGLVTSTVKPPELEAIIQQVAQGECALSSEVRDSLLQEWVWPEKLAEDAAMPESLTQREAEVLTLVVQGLTNAQIAETLSLTLSTVKGHVSRILEKLGLKNRAQLICWATQQAKK